MITDIGWGQIIFSGGIAVVLVAIVKAMMYNYITYRGHDTICHKKSVEVYQRIQDIEKTASRERSEIMRAIGKLEGTFNAKIK